MWRHRRKYRKHALPLIILAILSYNTSLYPQTKISKDSVYLTTPDKIIQIPGYKTFAVNGTFVKIPVSPVPSGITFSERTPVFIDSLRVITGKRLGFQFNSDDVLGNNSL
jgi:hypothetical protein